MKARPTLALLVKKSFEMIGAMEKGIEAGKITTPPTGVYNGVDLKILPKYLCFKAALLREKILLQYLVVALIGIFSVYFLISRHEISNLYTQLRQKEYILAPGVVDFTPASPQTVSDQYVDDAAMSFLSLLGNINAINIDDNYQRLSKFMGAELKIHFDAEVAEWRETVKLENISEILKITNKEIVSDDSGYYRVVAIAKRERYVNNEFLGTSNEIVEIVLQLVPPQKGKQWFLQINSLRRSESNSFRGRETKVKSLKNKRSKNE